MSRGKLLAPWAKKAHNGGKKVDLICNGSNEFVILCNGTDRHEIRTKSQSVSSVEP